ncbi:MAG: WYL domain-containing protein [Eggerthellaceae bacterium]|nr:WYL domain-containing protein [Eggerthellaceae bacterium]
MANSGNQKEKLLALLRMLQAESDREQGLTMPQIIERLEEGGLPAERKAVYRDLEALRNAGFDVQTLPTRPVQYALVRTDLSFDDVMMLIDVVQSSPFLTERKSNQLVKNLKDLVSRRERRSLDKRVHVQGRIRNQNESIFHNVDRIHEAMQLKRKVEFLYYSFDTNLKRVARHGGKRYAVTPVRIVFSENNYYLVAYVDGEGADDGEFRTYRVDRMRIAQLSDMPAARNAAIANYGADEFAYQSFGMFHGERVTATLHVEAPLMDAIVDRFGRDVEVVKSTSEFADVRVKVQKSPQFFGWIAGLSGQVTIRAPKRLAAEYRDWLQSLV